MTLPRLTVCIYTHMRHQDRCDYACTTATTVIQKALNDYAGPVHIHVADDNSRRYMLVNLL